MRTDFTFPSADGKTQIHAVKWTPEGAPRYILQLTHGMVEFIDRYEPFALYLNTLGVLCVGHDHLGHGDSVTDKSEWGFFAEPNPSGVLVEDMHALRVRTQKEYPALPYFMLGHSMGSYLLRKYLAFHASGLAGALVVGTGFVAPAAADFGLGLCRARAALQGWHYRSRTVAKLAMGGGAYAQFDSDGSHPENSWLTRATDIVRRYYQEPRCTFRFTLNGYKGLFEAVGFSCRPENAALIPHNLPLLLTSGDRDPVGDLGAGVKKVFEMYKTAGLKNLTLKLYPGARHEILNETNREEVWRDMAAWMDQLAK